MRNRVVFRISLAGGIAVSLAAAPAAEAARRYSLAGNILLEDGDDVFMFPQLAPNYARSIGFDYGTNSNSGNATLIMGDKYQAWGVSLHRGDTQTPWMHDPNRSMTNLSGVKSSLGSETLVQDPAVPASGNGGGGGGGGGNTDGGGDGSGDGESPSGIPMDGETGGGDGTDVSEEGQTAAGLGATPKTVFDAFYASANPGKSAWGLRLTLGSDKTFNDPKASGAKESFDAEHFFAATFGYSDQGGTFKWDGAGTLLVGMGSSTVSGKEVQKSSRYDLTVNARASTPLAGEKDTRLGFIGLLRYGASTIEPKGAGKQAADDLRLNFGAGPVVQVTDRISVAGYAMIGVTRQTHDPDSKEKGDLDGRMGVLFPGVNLATEIKLKEWLFFRSGAEYTYTFLAQDKGKANSGGFEASSRADSFIWNTGVGMKFADLTVDGALSHQFITDGPDFLGGDGPLFGMVSAGAKF